MPRTLVHYRLVIILVFIHQLAFSQVPITILHTSDEHSSLLPLPISEYGQGSGRGGFARVAHKISELRRENPDLLVFSSGDVVGGTPFAWLLPESEAAELNLMAQMGYNAVAVGNHEFDYGPDFLAQYYSTHAKQMQDLQLPILCSNIDIPTEHPLENVGILDHLILEGPESLKIGVFALLGKHAVSVAPAAKPIQFTDQAAAAKKAVALLKQKGAEMIICLSHSGRDEDVALAKSVEGIHLILGGHEHATTEQPIIEKSTVIFHSGNYTEKLGQLKGVFDREKGVFELQNEAEGLAYHYLPNAESGEDATIQIAVEYYERLLNEKVKQWTRDRVSSHDQEIFRRNFDLDRGAGFKESSIGNYVTDAMRFAGERITASPVAIAMQADGILRSDLKSFDGSRSGRSVTFSDLVTVSSLGMGIDQRAGYPMISCYLTPEEVGKLAEIAAFIPLAKGGTAHLQFSGLHMRYDANRASWFQVPFINQPLPSYNAVSEWQLYNQLDYAQASMRTPEKDELIHLVSDYYLASFLPEIGRILPRLNIEFKNKQGEVVENLDDLILVTSDGQEYKVWQALVDYGLSFTDRHLPDFYASPQNRVAQVKLNSLWWTPFFVFLGMTGVVILLIFIFRSRRSKGVGKA
ncbi:MAG: bifunctional metallophosphatase/5'-nucleotidase [Cyclobacteriaceae bacterium]|nr:bifunctional metallophosphatase/5'-nucleotidase [Cyclobacteriaceae bacterium]MCH8517624.1 bifunctional metallophosphatase/5'-nucleotidase [Cyclobacteriaceae bacterium]